MKTTQNTKSTKERYKMLTLIFVCVVINYMDRVNISVASTDLTNELGLSNIQMGYIFSAFGLTYALSQIPGGILADFVKPRILYPIILGLWSVVTLLQGFANSFISLLGFRFSIGIFEAPSYPTNNKIVTNWFPENERASAIGIYTSGQFLGLALLSPVLFAIMKYSGWRGLFIISGIIGLGWAVIWYLFYRDPQESKKISNQELELIEKGGGLGSQVDNAKKGQKYTWADFAQAFTSRKLWGIYIGQFCLGAITMFFLTWFPKYLVEFRGFDFIKSGFLASIPFLAAFFGVLLSGFTSDLLVRKGYSREVARKTPILVGMLLSVIIIAANFTDNTFWVMLYLSLAFFGNGLASITWVFVSTLAPKKTIGLVGGVFNLVGGSSAFIIPTAIGYLANDGNFAPALFFIGALALLGFFSYIFLVGKVERIGELTTN